MLSGCLYPFRRIAVDAAIPSALMLVPHVNGEGANAGDGGDDFVAVLHRAQSLVVRPTADHVAGMQGCHGRDIREQVDDWSLHVAGGIVPPTFSVYVDGDVQVVRIRDVIFRD